MKIRSLLAAGSIGFIFLVVHGINAAAAELKVLSAFGMQSLLEDFGPKFEHAAGHNLAMSAPVLLLTADPQLPSISKSKKPPDHKPSLPLAKLRMKSPRPLYSHAPFFPPPTTPCPTWVILCSS